MLRDPERVATALGWFSIGLGLAQLASPRGVSRLIGVSESEENRKTMLAIGMREIASGVGILTQSQRAPWVWSRVAGDAMDLALLGRGLNSRHTDRNRLAAATAAVVGVTLLDYLTSHQLSRRSNGHAATQARQDRGIQVDKTITVARPPEEVYRFWRDFSNLPRFMAHLESVQVLDDRRSRWKANAPAGTTVEWDAEIVEDREGESIAWRSLQHADVHNWGSVRFSPAPGDRGTEVRVQLRYEPPGGTLGAIVAKLFGEEPGQQVAGDLRRFKQVLELGEVVHSDASVHRGMHPAQPSDRAPLAQNTQGGM
ncbi:MAG: SRPBCC family protein [Gemmatimonadales bacterium]|nr:SRPBCC family protein [Gemmatimonadales bacterium]